ncbi:MAG: LUD domain-containing protein [Acidobacteriota bacterium]
MLKKWRLKRRIKKILKNQNLQRALQNSLNHFYQGFLTSIEEYDFDSLKNQVKEIKEKSIENLDYLIEKFKQEVKKSGSKFYFAERSEDALKIVEKIAREKNAKLIVKSKSLVSEEIGLNHHLEKRGFKVIETDLGEWIIQLSNQKPTHFTAPALHMSKEDVAELFSRKFNKEFEPDIKKLVDFAKKELRKYFLEADMGISGANIGIAETGTVVIVSNEGNARLVTSLPPIHIVLISIEKIVSSIEEAAKILKVLTKTATGQKITSYVSFITGPSRTADIEKEITIGVHGPEEVHVILIDNGRKKIIDDTLWKKVLYCIKCGGCLTICPVYNSVSGLIFSGPIYPGGIGLALTSVINSHKETFPYLNLCSDCKKCEEFCPTGIPVPDMISELKNIRGSGVKEKIFMNYFKNNKFRESLLEFLSFAQIPWKKDDFIINSVLPSSKYKYFPSIKRDGIKLSIKENKRKKVLMFLGCLIRDFYPSIGISTFRIIEKMGFQPITSEELVCCGAPALHLGDKKSLYYMAKKNFEVFRKISPEFIVTLCPTGNGILKYEYKKIIEENIHAFSEIIYDFSVFLEKFNFIPKTITENEKIYFHHPCHSLNFIHVKEEPRNLLKKAEYDVIEENEPYTCCGFSGAFSFLYPDISESIWNKKKNSILKSNVNKVVTTCPGCIFQLKGGLKKEGLPIDVFHLAETLKI